MNIPEICRFAPSTWTEPQWATRGIGDGRGGSREAEGARGSKGEVGGGRGKSGSCRELQGEARWMQGRDKREA